MTVNIQDIYFDTPSLDSLEEELKSLRESRELLCAIWKWYGPHGPRADNLSTKELHSKVVQKTLRGVLMPEELHIELAKHFKFDYSG